MLSFCSTFIVIIITKNPGMRGRGISVHGQPSVTTELWLGLLSPLGAWAGTSGPSPGGRSAWAGRQWNLVLTDARVLGSWGCPAVSGAGSLHTRGAPGESDGLVRPCRQGSRLLLAPAWLECLPAEHWASPALPAGSWGGVLGV